MMNTLLVMGSPRRDGHTAALLREAKKYLEGDMVEIDVYRDTIHPCTNCGYCEKQAACSIEDDMQTVYEALLEVDAIILAAPVFFSDLPGQVFNLISRMQMLYWDDRVKALPPKKGLMLLTAGGDATAVPAIASGRRSLSIMGAKEREQVLSLETNRLPAAEDEAALRAIATEVAWLQR